MIRLRRLSREVSRIIDADFLRCVHGDEPILSDYEVDDIIPAIELEAFDDAMASIPGGAVRPAYDAHMAQAVRSSLPLTRRAASDPTLWWWLTLRKQPDLARRRWADAKGEISIERMLGSVARNAFGRLWWGAEMVRADNPSLAQLFGNQDLFEAVIGRKLGRSAAALKVILDRLAEKPGVAARETVRDLHQVLSTIVLETLTPEDLGVELDRLYGERSANPVSPK